MNPPRTKENMQLTNSMFRKEIGFFTDVLSLLNSELARVGEQPLRVAKYLHGVCELGREVVYLEDLRSSGFISYDRKKGLDVEHVILIIHELSRLHASSVLLMSRKDYREIENKIPTLEELWFMVDDKNQMQTLFYGLMETGVNIAENCPGYERVHIHLKKIMNNVMETMSEDLKFEDHLKVICHGDSWTTNFLFR